MTAEIAITTVNKTSKYFGPEIRTVEFSCERICCSRIACIFDKMFPSESLGFMRTCSLIGAQSKQPNHKCTTRLREIGEIRTYCGMQRSNYRIRTTARDGMRAEVM